MYNTQRSSSRSFGSKRSGSYNGGSRGFQKRSSFGGRFKKRLDVNLFIKKASGVVDSVEETSSEVLFADYALSEKLKRNVAEHGYVSPTPIQEKTIPHLLEGKDVIGIANTGTGKTAAFLIPLLNKVSLDRTQRVLIVTPTRELAMQIVDEMYALARGMDINAVLCIGGASLYRQEQNLRRNPHFVIGTPGRIKDLIQRRRLNLGLFQNIVLDEVDRMVDIGFIKDIQYIVSLLPEKRQSLFFSATVSEKEQGIMHSFLTNPITISVKQQATSENVDQDIVRITGGQNKVDVLHDLLNKEGVDKVLVFGQTKWGIEKLAKLLLDRGFKAAAIHGNKTQGQRRMALEQFKQDQVKILLATDVASRGLDIDNITHVINYDQPASYEDYIHRIGRTGRAGKKGIALTFVD